MALNSHHPGSQVRLRCNQELRNMNNVEVITVVKQDGKDHVTFVCPDCGETHQSLRFGF